MTGLEVEELLSVLGRIAKALERLAAPADEAGRPPDNAASLVHSLDYLTEVGRDLVRLGACQSYLSANSQTKLDEVNAVRRELETVL